MSFDIWRPWGGLVFLHPEIWEYPLLVFYVLTALLLLVRFRQDFRRLGWQRFSLFLVLLVASLLVSNLLVLSFSLPRLLPPPNVPTEPVSPFTPLLGALPVIVAGTWFGAGPALLVGLVGGILRVGVIGGGITDPFYFAFFGFLVGFFLRQDYQGRLPLIVRQPIIAGPLATIFASPLLLLSVLAHTANSGLAGLDYAMTLTQANLGPALLESLVAAFFVQGVYLLSPRLCPVRVAHQPPPYSRTLRRRLLFIFVPMILIMTAVLVYAVTATTLRVATLEVVDEMARDANSAAEGIPYFIHTGQGLLVEFANDEILRHSDPITLEAHLRGDLRSVAFFDQLILFDATKQQLAMYPPSPVGDSELTSREEVLLQRVVESGATQISSVHRSRRDEAILSFLAPVENEETGERFGVLLGRTRLDVNPVIRRVLASLQWTRARGEGFVVDAEGHIVAHSDSDMLLAEWHVDEERPHIATVLRGWAYESRNPMDNTRQLVYYLPVEGYPWAVAIRLPYEVVLEQATQVATPLLILQILLGGGLVVVIPLATSWLTRPLKQLATAADHIAEGDLTQSVHVPGSDEVARVGDAFEDMRVRLKDRLEDLSLLLQISQAVSATLELPEGVPFILEGVLKATHAQVARIVLLAAGGEPQMVMARGEPREGLGALDRALVTAVKELDHPLVVENLARARTLADPDALSGPIKAAIALPVCTKDLVPAVMWVGYGEVRQFDASEIDLLSTLASQTAVLVENARLFQAAEGGRRRLAAILTSTTDAVLVTDRDDCILLVNPAAERAFDIAADVVVGQKIDQAELAPVLVRVFEEPLPPNEALTEEVPLPDGRTLYASVSTILSADDERIGRVALMRDVTHFKELDEMKSEFVATVSHDLRAPLTFIRGYATMLPMVGEFNDMQHEYIEKILHGVGQMSELIDDLLDLGRIEAGVGLEREPCHLGAILVDAVDGMRARATAKGLTLRLEPTESVAVVAGDASLLRQAVTNLVDNAVKYTPSGGIVTVGLSMRDEHAVIRVADTGIGIAPDDQLRLFEKFYRIRRRDTMDIPGTGLGLAIVKSIVERHGGKVWVDSELDKGSTFYVSLSMGEIEPPEAQVTQ
ncbi:MAG: ATP-binding protein [Chloroflexota bacterium]|nr:ATP-binding protein [Chloroflexota bacterium]